MKRLLALLALLFAAVNVMGVVYCLVLGLPSAAFGGLILTLAGVTVAQQLLGVQQ